MWASPKRLYLQSRQSSPGKTTLGIRSFPMGDTHNIVQQLQHCRQMQTVVQLLWTPEQGGSITGAWTICLRIYSLTENRKQRFLSQNANKTGADQPSHRDQESRGCSQTVILIRLWVWKTKLETWPPQRIQIVPQLNRSGLFEIYAVKDVSSHKECQEIQSEL